MWLVDDPLFLEHRARGYHPERPERLIAARAAVAALEAEGLAFERVPGRDAEEDEIATVHDAAYLEELENVRGLYAALDDDTYLGPRSVQAAVRAAGGAIALVEKILDPTGPNTGLALLRPPGHHARPSGGMGFCLLNNIAIAARAARKKGIERIAIVDWDVHHGNGTEEAFYEDPHVLFTSIHQYPFYPGTGAAASTGRGEGEGYTVNVPLSQSATDTTYASVFERVLIPVLESYAPELVLVSAGFDAHARDPLAAMSLTSAAYEQMARAVMRVAERSAGGRVGVVLEGGYDLAGLSESLTATVRGLTSTASTDGSLEKAQERAPLSVGRGGPEPSAESQRHGLEIENARATAAVKWRI
jgi:acetoin utilization deacetylase AcuC-like enzyme